MARFVRAREGKAEVRGETMPMSRGGVEVEA